MLEIDVDIRRLVALGGNEALEQQIGLGGVDGGDAERVADGGIGRRAAALAEDLLRPGETHDVVDGEEIGRVVQLADQVEFVAQLVADPGRQPLRVALGGALPGQVLQLLLRRAPALGDLVGIFVAQLIEGEMAGLGDLDRAGDGLGMVAEQPHHLLRRLQVALGIGVQTPAGGADGAMLTDAGQHVLQRPALRGVAMHVVSGDQRGAVALGQRRQPGHALGVIAAIEVMGGQVQALAQHAAIGRKVAAKAAIDGKRRLPTGLGVGFRRQDDKNLPGPGLGHIGPGQVAFALRRPPASHGQQLRQPAIGGPVGREAQQARAVLEIEPGAHHQPDAGLLAGDMGPHHPGQRVAVRHCDRRMPQRRRRHRQLLRMRRPPQKRKIAAHLQLDITGGGGAF